MIDNPYALFVELYGRDEFKDFTHIWVLDDFENNQDECNLRAIKKPPKHNTTPLNGDYSKLFKAVCRNTRPYYGLIQSNFCTRQKIVLIKVIKTLAIVANNITIVNRKIAKI